MQGRLEEQEQAEAACTQPSGQSVPADKLRSKVHNGVPPVVKRKRRKPANWRCEEHNTVLAARIHRCSCKQPC
eukprot:scaffold274342_cov13-Tisochrysis_lutea.AAC.1